MANIEITIWSQASKVLIAAENLADAANVLQAAISNVQAKIDQEIEAVAHRSKIDGRCLRGKGSVDNESGLIRCGFCNELVSDYYD